MSVCPSQGLRWTLAGDLWPEQSGLGTSQPLYSRHNDDTAATRTERGGGREGGGGEEEEEEEENHQEEVALVVSARRADEVLGRKTTLDGGDT